MSMKALAKSIPVIKLQNLTGMEQTLTLEGGDSASIGPRATVKVATNLFLNLPAPRIFKMTNVTTKDLVDAGLIKRKGEGAPAPSPALESTPADASATTAPALAAPAVTSAPTTSAPAPVIEQKAEPKPQPKADAEPTKPTK